ncbi:DUF305 domain-containing protein [Streptomyces sp. NBC_00582]|uniref:DUF305 domain-containing protein n=1 Tax=Streptomyces sp. NBC_00582 TaxID=2975783 RepID=UPI002E801045|nr:DUF305 domain-containing protein [Streptomyces sp. NBC_00582]WUB65029.1 DUF305 domain-containing protein [Streptomyces sp. NBC_00582]
MTSTSTSTTTSTGNGVDTGIGTGTGAGTRTGTRGPVRRAALAAATVTAALLLTACGGDADSASSASSAPSTSSGGAHNAQDVTFAQGMIPHHRQALEMAALAADRASSAQVKDLAARIEKAQDPEIEKMTGWLKAWGEDVPAEDASADDSMPGMDHSGSGGMAGMMDDAAMKSLEKTSGEAFDTAFLTLMVEHHEGAVEMARTERGKGGYQPAKDMAGDIVTGQTAEIAEMNGLLGKKS